ncbi:anthranilate synthase component II [Clostridium saccharobutylicum]|uniref:Anthranilate synthase component II n=1 Tax=Clostridium saccharobutylicum DSM 13864 TaxID=1345695 RepID=U5MR32_CLOSA|nr:aminodeoxychorismate/anthranilate synthase component II [Clostridium saccharobutylicum]AGX42136.1 anthranilate synthase component II [Clostridium saccharobutylicum DSM 13864]AQR89416.1 aminodeoxychorismate/anthranilate synthase component 2 [Clostridium saccharobutylicum]AQR99318.1 aminodeoxychorismate/anthranilate synthase component 2 [Clostridium saccharobutylicum]AQS09049.1 aminodeoxychorismate/anthranilate synthase component 2 [Clostridium saccharobutylicum]AQS13304.1 aminodeoxychorismat
MLLMIDNYDSFVYNLVRYFEEIEEEIEVVRNDKINIESIDKDKYIGIIISPGPKTPNDAGRCLEIIDKFKGKIPILGICLGHQCIGHYFGGKVIKGEKPMHGKISEIAHNNKQIFFGVKNPLKVTRYHSLIIDKKEFPEQLQITAETLDGVIMGISHNIFPIYGVQFHPEAELTEEGHKILQNFIIECRRFNND